MATLTCKLPNDLAERLDAEATRQRRSKSAILRDALEQSLATSESPRMAIDYVRDLFASVMDGPSDLATNPEYMRDFGK